MEITSQHVTKGNRKEHEHVKFYFIDSPICREGKVRHASTRESSYKGHAQFMWLLRFLNLRRLA